MLVAEKYAGVFEKGMHGSPPLAATTSRLQWHTKCCARLKSEKLLDHVQGIELALPHRALLNKLQDRNTPTRSYRNHAGLGLLIGIVMKDTIEARPLIQKGIAASVCSSARGGNSACCASHPPLNVRKATMDAAIEKLDQLVAGIQLQA
jgi:acetylornithine/succinyldiaminopimelate/putrescine aminotransferase